MSTAISSARYTDLYDYCTTSTQINDDLTGQGGRLGNRLSHFEATCREQGYRVDGDNLGGALQSYGTWAMPIDRHVRRVGEDFQRADGAWGQSRLPDSKWEKWKLGIGNALDKLWAYKDVVMPAVAGVLVIRPSSTRVGEVAIKTPTWLKQIKMDRVVWEALNLNVKLRSIKPENLMSHMIKQLKPGEFATSKLLLLTIAIEGGKQFMEDAEKYRGDRFKEWAAHIWNSSVVTLFSAGEVIAASYVVMSLGPKIALVVAGILKAVAVGGAVVVLLKVIIVVAVVVAILLLIGWAFDKLLDFVLESELSAEVIAALGDNLRLLDPLLQEGGRNLREAQTFMRDHIDQFVEYFKSGNELPPACMAI